MCVCTSGVCVCVFVSMPVIHKGLVLLVFSREDFSCLSQCHTKYSGNPFEQYTVKIQSSTTTHKLPGCGMRMNTNEPKQLDQSQVK